MGGAAEGVGARAAVRRLQGGPGSHEVVAALLQVSPGFFIDALKTMYGQQVYCMKDADLLKFTQPGIH